MKLFKEEVLQDLGKQLIARKETIAVAESVTSGAIQLAISTIMEASKFFQGGMTAYNIGQKYAHLKVEPIHAQQVNCVSEQVAEQMALNVSVLFNSDWGLGITGYGTPVPESDDQVFAFYAIAFRGEIRKAGKMNPSLDETLNLQLYFANELLTMLTDLTKSA